MGLYPFSCKIPPSPGSSSGVSCTFLKLQHPGLQFLIRAVPMEPFFVMGYIRAFRSMSAG